MKSDQHLSVDQLIDYGIRLAQENKPQSARRFFEKALERDPENIPALLWLAGLGDSPDKSYRYVVRVLEIDPKNKRAHAALRWIRRREQEEKALAASVMAGAASSILRTGVEAQEEPPASRSTPLWLGILAALIVLCGAVATIYFSHPASAVAQVQPTIVATKVAAVVPTTTATPAVTATKPPTATPTPTDPPTPTLPPTEIPTATPLPPTATAVPPTATLEPPTVTPEPPTPMPELPTATLAPQIVDNTSSANSGLAPAGERWIDVDLSQQRLVAYEGDTPVRTVIVSTGLPGTPTVTGQYHIYVKYLAQTMSGPGYYLPDVPYVMYFYEGYGIHGTYWHHNFGHPMSHGCVNTPTPDAQWLYNWASVGTLVNVHY